MESREVKCAKCDKSVSSVEQLKIHICVEHIAYYPYRCLLCCHDVWLPTHHSVTIHCNQLHKATEPKVEVCENEKKSKRLDEMVSRWLDANALPEDQQSTVSITSVDSKHIIRALMPQLTNEIAGVVSSSVDNPSEIASASDHWNANVAAASVIPTPSVDLTTPTSMLCCNLCGEIFVMDEERNADIATHIWLKHMDGLPRYVCRWCPTMSVSSLATIREHVTRRHPDKDPNDIRDNHITAAPLYLLQLHRCFDEEVVESLQRTEQKKRNTDSMAKEKSKAVRKEGGAEGELPLGTPLGTSVGLQQWTTTDGGLATYEPSSQQHQSKRRRLCGSTLQKVRGGPPCGKCRSETVHSDTGRRYHVWAHHMNDVGVCVCGHCGFKCNQRKAEMLRHMNKMHPNKDPNNFVDNRIEKRELFVETMKECFRK